MVGGGGDHLSFTLFPTLTSPHIPSLVCSLAAFSSITQDRLSDYLSLAGSYLPRPRSLPCIRFRPSVSPPAWR